MATANAVSRHMSVVFTFEVIRDIDGNLDMSSTSEQAISGEELLIIGMGMIDQGLDAIKAATGNELSPTDVDLQLEDEV